MDTIIAPPSGSYLENRDQRQAAHDGGIRLSDQKASTALIESVPALASLPMDFLRNRGVIQKREKNKWIEI
jgi:hypothetical protein